MQAQPLRELGFGGVLGSGVALIAAYLMYRCFCARRRADQILEQEPPRCFWSRRFAILSSAIILIGGVLAFGLTRINTDPSLLDYFKPNDELREGLEKVDRHGGANPLTLVVSSTNGSKLNTDEAYRQLWSLHSALENYRDVGTVLSLPTLLAEGNRTPFSFLLSYEKMLRIMSEPKHARVAKSFVSDDRDKRSFSCA